MDTEMGLAHEARHKCAQFRYLSPPRQGVSWLTARLVRWKDIHAWKVGGGGRNGAIEKEWGDE